MRMTLWAIQATVNGTQVPTFYLDAQVQGILDANHAHKVAHNIITSANPTHKGVYVSVMAIHYFVSPKGNA